MGTTRSQPRPARVETVGLPFDDTGAVSPGPDQRKER